MRDRERGLALVGLAVWTCLISSVPSWAGDEVINRTMRLRPAPIPAPGTAGWIGEVGEPSEFEAREFPSVLRDPRLPTEPDGLLWRRLQELHPEQTPLEILTQSPAELRDYLAEAGLRAGGPDTIHVLALRVDFLEDSAGGGSTTLDGGFDLRPADSAQVAVDPPPHDKAFFDAHLQAISRYYYKQSGGTMVLDWDIYPAENDSAYHLSDTADYGPWWMSGFDVDILDLAERLVRDSFALADTAAHPPDFRKYESFLLFHSGADFQGDIGRNSAFDIPSFNIFLAEPVAVQDSTFFIDLILVVPETVSQDGFLGALNGVMTHEFGHQLGFYDLYNVFNFYPQVGMFSLMDSGEQMYGRVWDPYREREVFVRGAIPGSVDPWHKLLFFPAGVQMNWITADTEIALPPVQLANELALVPVGGQGIVESSGSAHLSGSEYFILENRPYDINGDQLVYLEADSTTGVILGPRNIPTDVTDSLGIAEDTFGEFEQDYLLPGEGMLVWHIDNMTLNDAFSICYGCVNIFGDRRSVDVEEADGIEDLGNIYSVEWVGGQYDYWFPEGYTRFGPDTDPSTTSGGGAITDIDIEVLPTSTDTLRVAIQRGRIARGWPRYAGEPFANGGVTAAHVDRDGVEEIFTTGGAYLQKFEGDGEGGIFARVDSVFLAGPSVRQTFYGGTGQAQTVVCAATNVRVHAWDASDGDLELLRYPDSDQPFPDLRFTTAPAILDSVIIVGDNQGRVRGLLPEAANPLLWRTSAPGYAVTALAAGPLNESGGVILAWANEAGQLFLGGGSQRGGFELLAGWPRKVAPDAGAIVSVLLIQGAPGEEGLILAADDTGYVGCWDASGTLKSGWPQDVGGGVTGRLAVGDPDGDGVLEVVATTFAGDIHLLSLEGREEAGWPRSVWHADETFRSAVRSGPMIADLNGDGRPEIIQGSADGTLHAFDIGGEEIDGYPALVGYGILSGPGLHALGPQGEARFLAADDEGFVTVIRTGLGDSGWGPGEMWQSTCDASRTFFYQRQYVPEPVGWSGLLDEEQLIFTPNPVRGRQGALRLRMGRSGTVQVRLFDTSGQQVWEETFDDVATGMEGDLVNLDLADVAPGLYVAKITARGGGDEINVMRKLAVVR